jgi:long-subunit fatty acid transport protein
MGGAFIGVADDATAASWNPGGLIQLEMPEASIVLSAETLIEERTFSMNPGASGRYDISLYDVNYLSLAYPFAWRNMNMVISLNYQTLYDFNKKREYDYSFQDINTRTIETDDWIKNIETEESGPRKTSLETTGYLKTISPAFALQITPDISIGFTFNYYSPSLGCKWETEYNDYYDGIWTRIITTNDKPPDLSTTTETISEHSISRLVHHRYEFEFESSANPFDIFKKEASYNIGFLWSINQYFTLGGVYKAPFTAVVSYKEKGYEEYGDQESVNIADPEDARQTSILYDIVINEKQEMEMPVSYGLGVAYRFSDLFSMDLDVYRTDWQNFLLRQADGREISLITGKEISESNTGPTYQVRIGAEYLFIIKERYIVPVRGGIFYDPEPTEGDPEAFYGISIGSGITVGKFVFDAAYQYRWGNEVRKIYVYQEEEFQDVKQHTVYASLIYHF